VVTKGRLSAKQRGLLEAAKQHAKLHYKKNITSMSAILLTKKGNKYSGINVKYKNIWKCICAERVAIAKAVEAGDTEFDSIVTVKYFPETDSYEVINMCGECRQIAICHKPFSAIVINNKKVKAVPVEDVFPYPYI
jgi:cytidine deaminase